MGCPLSGAQSMPLFWLDGSVCLIGNLPFAPLQPLGQRSEWRKLNSAPVENLNISMRLGLRSGANLSVSPREPLFFLLFPSFFTLPLLHPIPGCICICIYSPTVVVYLRVLPIIVCSYVGYCFVKDKKQ